MLRQKPGIESIAKMFINQLLAPYKLKYDLSVELKDNIYWVNLKGDDISFLIGRKGVILYSLQHLLRLYLRRSMDEEVMVTLDINGYRADKERKLVFLAKKAAFRVKKTGRKFVFRPMPAALRRIIHKTLENNPEVITYSEGKEPRRRVIVALKSRNG
ncbi:MAG: KH domain-containing protein [bacterium]|nr:KH domain-containing protein [bacterium]